MSRGSELLGCYEVLRKTKTFPESFWVVMVIDGEKPSIAVIETMEGVHQVESSRLQKAIEQGDIRLIER